MADKEYIDREAALESVREKLLITDALPAGIPKDASTFTLASMQHSLERIPAADVRPVVRGEWREWWPGDCALIMTGEEMLWMCSECTAKFSDKSAFCPNCGADMRPTSMSGANREEN